MAKGPKPVLWGTEETETDRDFMADMRISEEFDPSYIPGYSEIAKANDLAASNAADSVKRHYYKQIGAAPRELPYQMAWVRVRGVDGERSPNADVGASEWRRRGYRPLPAAELQPGGSLYEHFGWRMPPAAHVSADGTICREDTQLWAIDGARANALEQARLAYTKEFHEPREREASSGFERTSIHFAEEDRRTLNL